MGSCRSVNRNWKVCPRSRLTLLDTAIMRGGGTASGVSLQVSLQASCIYVLALGL